MATTPNFGELHAISNFTFLRGASHPEELVTRAYKLGYQALAITDECSLAGVVRAHIAARDHGLHLIIGAEFSLADGPRLVLLATNRQGYGNLSELITQGRRAADKGTYRLTRADLTSGIPECLALLIPGLEIDKETVRWFARTFSGRAWLAVELLCGPNDKTR
ncbi:MAG: PHP domain-containing protein, partial [Acidiferrobacterales bacterium]